MMRRYRYGKQRTPAYHRGMALLTFIVAVMIVAWLLTQTTKWNWPGL